MIRAVEIILFLAPLLAFGAWRMMLPDTEVTYTHIAAFAASLILILGVLVWLRLSDAEPPGATYVPAELHNGSVAPAHGAP